MVLLRKPQPTRDAILRHYETTASDGRRPHLGGSMIGDDCHRKLWYIFRWIKKVNFDGRLYKLFQRGHDSEHVFIKMLRDVGIQVLDINPDTGKQWSVSAIRDHFGGSFDGIGLGLAEAPETWHLLEFKTHNDASFQDLVKKTVIGSKPTHYAQMQIYMHLGGFTRAFYMAVNKNTDEIYTERIKYDPVYASKLLIKAEKIIDAERPPTRAFKEDFYLCLWCNFNGQCHKGEFSERNCRTCMYSTPVEGKIWSCGKFKTNIPLDVQKEHHPCHRFIPDLVPLEQIDVDGENIIYKDWIDDGTNNYPTKIIPEP